MKLTNGMIKTQIHDDLPFVSFIVPTYNEEKNIARCLTSIKNQDYPKDKIEVIVVDGMSEDNTVNIAKNFDVRIIMNRKRIVGNAMNIGVKEAKGDIFASLGADSEIYQKDWLRQMVLPFSDPKVCGTLTDFRISKTYPPISRCYHLMGGDPLISFVHSSTNTYNKILVMTKENYYPTGANLLRRDLVSKAGNFKAFMPRMEDVDMTYHLLRDGYKLVLVPNTYMYHLYVGNFSSYLRKTYMKILIFIECQRFCEFSFVPDNPTSKIKLLKRMLSHIAIVGLLIRTIKGIREDHDFSWLYYPLIVLSTLTIQFIVLTSNAKGRKLLKSFMGIK